MYSFLDEFIKTHDVGDFALFRGSDEDFKKMELEMAIKKLTKEEKLDFYSSYMADDPIIILDIDDKDFFDNIEKIRDMAHEKLEFAYDLCLLDDTEYSIKMMNVDTCLDIAIIDISGVQIYGGLSKFKKIKLYKSRYGVFGVFQKENGACVYEYAPKGDSMYVDYDVSSVENKKQYIKNFLKRNKRLLAYFEIAVVGNLVSYGILKNSYSLLPSVIGSLVGITGGALISKIFEDKLISDQKPDDMLRLPRCFSVKTSLNGGVIEFTNKDLIKKNKDIEKIK